MTDYTINQIKEKGFIDVIDYNNTLTWGSQFTQTLKGKEYTFIVIDKYFKDHKQYLRITLLNK